MKGILKLCNSFPYLHVFRRPKQGIRRALGPWLCANLINKSSQVGKHLLNEEKASLHVQEAMTMGFTHLEDSGKAELLSDLARTYPQEGLAVRAPAAALATCCCCSTAERCSHPTFLRRDPEGICNSAPTTHAGSSQPGTTRARAS